ncbi:hypothetical protein [Snuella lapsa]|uniref:Fibronectin type-III domain-containing protein n=1 Tax=Snuella lapsa TaxID=870481 RepID=A0ABP6XQ43_9FLAO
MRKSILYIGLFLSVFGISCSGGDSDPEPKAQPKKNPEPTSLVFPEQNSECTEGTNITETHSTILFKWNTSANTGSYELTVKNLISEEVLTYTTSTNEYSVDLLRGVPYSWFITSISKFNDGGTATSATWKFYNAGVGIVNYAPFPATAVAPADNSSIPSSITVTLEWSGSDVDNDIASYDVYFGTTQTPLLLSSGVTVTTLNNVSIVPTTTYYWYVVTKDQQGNSSTSEIFEFNVN